MKNHLEEKLYSQRAIQITTYLVSPIISGFLIRSNFNKLGEPRKGNAAIIISILTTLTVCTALFFAPENIVDKIPNALFPLIYTGIIYYYVEKTQGSSLQFHKEHNGEFYSGWRIFKINIIPIILIIVSAFIAGDLMKNKTNYDEIEYTNNVNQFVKNENLSLMIMNNIDSYSNNELRVKVNENRILWNENLNIIKNVKNIKGITPEIIEQNSLLEKYCKLRLEENSFLKIWALNPSRFDQLGLENTQKEIESILGQLN